MSHKYRIKQLRAAIRLPGNSQKSYKFFCRGLDIRVLEEMQSLYADQVAPLIRQKTDAIVKKAKRASGSDAS